MASAIAIPLARSSEALILQPSELTDDIITILNTERAPLEIWIECARGLLAQGNVKSYSKLLRAICDEGSAKRDTSPNAKFVHVQALCSLADLNLQEARLTEDPEKKRELNNMANMYYFEAQRVSPLEMLPNLGLGEQALAAGDIATARKEFEKATRLRCNNRPSVAGILGLARLAFHNESYGEALSHFRRALRECPACPAEVRMAIGACHFRLGDVAQAESAYKRAVELDPGCTQALLGLAVMAMAVGEDAESTRRGSQLLAQAFHQDPENPHTLTLLAHFSLQQGLASSAERLASAALERIGHDEPALRAEATCLLGRAKHAQGLLAEASRYYQRALAVDPKQQVSRLALAQLSVLRGESLNAVTALEKLLEDRPAWIDALRVLAPLCPRQPNASAAARPAGHFKQAADRQPENADLWEMLGDCLAGADPSGALNAYTTAINLRRKAAEQNDGAAAATPAVPARLLNNAAVLQMRAGDASAAQKLVAESLSSAAAGGLSDLGPQAQVTLGYNAARIREASGDLQGAEGEYKALLEQFPQYSDCHLRLACIAKAQGDIALAQDWATRATEASGRSADSLALMAGLHLERRNVEAAKKCLEELTASLGEGAAESYSRVALGNVHLLSIPNKYDNSEHVRKAETQLTYAMSSFKRVLQRDPGNIFAANGLGCVFAELGRFNEAKEVFLRVKEAAAGTDGFLRFPDAWINLASVYMALGQPDAAEQGYLSALRRFTGPRDSRLLLYLAKAQHAAGNTLAAKHTMCKALQLAPSNPGLRFNVAYLLQEKATQTLKKTWAPGDASKPKELLAAVGYLNTCYRIFEALKKAGNAATGILDERLVSHINYVAELYDQAKQMVKVAEAEAAAAATRLEEQRIRMEAAAKLREVEAQRKAAEAEAEARAREEVAREAAQKLERLKQEWRQGAALSKAAEAGDASAVGKGRQGAAEPDAVDALFAMDSEEEDFDYDPTKQDSDGEGGGALQGAAALQAAGLLSSDEDDEDFGGDGSDKEGAQPAAAAAPPASAKGGRLKKRGREVEGASEDVAADEMGESDEDTVKKARHVVSLEDSDEEEGDAPAPTAKDLFGSDSE